ncbi:hypothetical protein QBC46DRAFT_454667 [Diplogelasinospora grovesii]|uniref:Uncharacterized protein n=1 Tax=Diplogelasinospora grovesii TaxID=303347 RepID=A0AAN6RYD2_9PEZI|nr:hypothetical protein QBC46DRAFT_454667 [Diplogelasinospora grovesii]
MDEYEIFREFASAPFSSRSVQMIKAAVRIIRTRYPRCLTFESSDDFNFPSKSTFDTQRDSLHMDERWADYTRDMSRLQEPGENDEISRSLWRLARQDHLDRKVIEDYLQLLRTNYSTLITIAEPNELQSDIDQLVTTISKRPAILPLRDGEQWLFAVVYPDCVHWFDSRPNSSIPQCLVASTGSIFPSWTGPKQTRSEDSGLLMLLGIRFLVSGATHLGQEEADMIVKRFRSMVFVELRCMKLNPGDGDFEDLLRHEYEQQSLFFNDAWDSAYREPTVDTIPLPGSSTPAEFTHQAVSPARSPDASPSASLPQPLLRAVPGRSIIPDDRKTILTVISNAVTASRSTRMTMATEISILWLSIHNGITLSEFHRRYNGILFYDKMEELKAMNAASRKIEHHIDKATFAQMREQQPKFRFWRDLCEIYHDKGPAKYTLLCAIPEKHRMSNMSKDLQDAKISEIRSRLSDQNDPLHRNLNRAEKLCKAIIESTLPAHKLMIEFYLFRAGEPLTNDSYEAFLSLESQPKIRIPRLQI